MTCLTESCYRTVYKFVRKMWTPAKCFVLICTALFLTSQGVSYGHNVLPVGHNHTPYFDEIASPPIFVLENLSNHLIGNVRAIDEDEDDTLTYSLAYDLMFYFIPGDEHHLQHYGHYYTINSETGEVRTGSDGLDFEALPYTYYPPYKYHTVVVTVEDGKGGSALFVYQIFVTDVDENGDQPSDATSPVLTNANTTSPVPTPEQFRILPRNNAKPANLRPSPVAQDRIIFNEIQNAPNDSEDWIELKNISDEDVSLTDWEISIVTPSEVRQVNRAEDAGKDEDIVTFPDYTLPTGGILLVVNTDPSETRLESGADITDLEHDPNEQPQYLVASEMRLPDTPYLLILRSATDKNGKSEAFEDIAGNYFRSSIYYHTQVWPLMYTFSPPNREGAELTLGQAWRRVAVEERGYTKGAWASSGYQSGIGYKAGTSIEVCLGTPGYPNDTVADESLTGRIAFSELMYATNGGLFSQPQWIELYNNTATAAEAVNLEGWTLVIEARDSETRHRYTEIELTALEIASGEAVLLVTRNRRHSEHLSEDQVYDLYNHSNVFSLGLRENAVIPASGFLLKLFAPDGTLVDSAGNLDGEKGIDIPTWELPSGRTEDGARTSLIRRYNEDSIALIGTESTSWVSAAAMALSESMYYGHKTDIGTPGYRRGGAAPVMLSDFSANRTEVGVIVEWRTASETNNAGFNILRGQTKDGSFVKINPTLILGAGTTAEQNSYTWTDTTAKPNVTHYYQIEDVSFSGDRQRLATVRMKGYVSASDKLTTTWSELKVQD
ncbi:MAG: hypothetical protein OXH39_16760 [Candidatus Poribacteria bacterium]|nr:hypothetical protein [Candidatus Poribacteria bacterium]